MRNMTPDAPRMPGVEKREGQLSRWVGFHGNAIMSGGKKGVALGGGVSLVLGGSVGALTAWLANVSWLLAALVAMAALFVFYTVGAYAVWDKADQERRQAESDLKDAGGKLEAERAKPRGAAGVFIEGGTGHTALGNTANFYGPPSGAAGQGTRPPASASVLPAPGPAAVCRDFRNEPVRLADLINQGRPSTLQGYTFDDCDIYGPAVITLVSGGGIENCQLGSGDVFIEVTVPRTLIGVIGLYNTLFRHCRFHRVGIAAPAELIETFRLG